MPYEFKFPDVGEGITEGNVVNWKVKEGDVVKVDQVLAEVETDKAVVEIPSPKAGTILKINFKAGETIKVGEVLVVIGEKGESVAASPAKEEPKKEEPKVEEKKEDPKKEEVKPVEVKKEEKASTSVIGEMEEAKDPSSLFKVPKQEEKKEEIKTTDKVLATPAVRKLAKDKGVDLSKVEGTGPQGRILENDLGGAKPTSAPQVKSTGVKSTRKYDFYGYVERIPYKGIRKVIGDNMVKSKFSAPHVSHMDEADITKLVKVRTEGKLVAKTQGIKLTYLPFVIKALIASLRKHTFVNATLDEEGAEIILKKYYNIGVAVDTENGLLVPVVKGADQKGILNLAKEIKELADKAKARKLDLQDMKGGTFTITNIGSLGGLFATPIINPPEAAILALGRIYEKVVLVEGKPEVRNILPFSVSFDHRIVDGAEIARFATDFIKFLEEPGMMLVS